MAVVGARQPWRAVGAVLAVADVAAAMAVEVVEM